ncbi:MAG TPA: GGDEF domain-containing protein [Longimicrobiales bacterium]|nr:GGDEF domain-containing protein [Longimicrobiales bacterium]
MTLRRPVSLLALFYAGAITLWVVGLVHGWTELSGSEWIYALVVALYASLSLAALHRRPSDRRVHVFVAAQAVSTLTIVWPVLDLSQPNGFLLWTTVVGGSFIYALPLALYVHLASIIPDPHRLADRRRWFLPLHYGLALAIGLFTVLMYADQILGSGRGDFLPIALDLPTARRVDALLNTGGYLYGGLGALLLLGTAALRYRSVQAKRQAMIVFAGIAPWTLYIAYSFLVTLVADGAPVSAEWDLALQAAVILIEAVALFVAVIGYQLFDMGLVVRKGLIYGSATAFAVGALYVLLLGAADLMRTTLGIRLEAWHVGAALMLLAVALQPVLRAARGLMDAVFFPGKIRLRRLHSTLIPSLARRTDLDAVASHLTRRLRRSLQLQSAALLLRDDSREFYRVRALSGAFRFGDEVRGAVMTGSDLRNCWVGAPGAVMMRGPGSWQDRIGSGCRDLPVMLELLGAECLVPFNLGDDLVAVLTLSGERVLSSLDRDDLTHLQMLAQQASAMLENARLFHLARHDALTGLARRRVFEERFALELSRAGRGFEPISVAMIDIDDFKEVNDRYGHLIGDRALRGVADVLRSVSRVTDVVARYGGEEFVMLLPATDENGARVVAAKLQEAIAANAIGLVPGLDLVVTLSIGIASVAPEDLGHDVQEFVRRADHALYGAKLAGKNRLEVFGPRERGAESSIKPPAAPHPLHG